MALALTACAGEPARVAPTSVVEGNTAFAVDLYRKLKDQPGNLFFSPHSISTALAMTYAGARGETEAQMAKTLHFNQPQDQLHPAFARLQKDLSEAKGCELAIANRLWGQKGYAFLDAFLKTTRDQYGAGLETLDFQTDTEGSRKTINAWVEKQTRDKIKDLLKPSVLTTDTRLVLTNAIYFKGSWKNKFENKRTKSTSFSVSGDRKVDVPLMVQTGEFRYADPKGLQVLELPYQGDALSMVVLLPQEAGGLPSLEMALTEETLKGWLDGLRMNQVTVFLPKFQMTSEFFLKDTLSALGMPLAFAVGRAGFSGMTEDPKGLCISDVVHKAFVDVGEEGTEAAAATAVMSRGGGPPHKAATFRADHPFLFLIRDRKSGAILFLGRVTDPTI